MSKKAPTKLVGLTVDEVSLVDRPANRRPFLLFKSEGGQRVNEVQVLKELVTKSEALERICASTGIAPADLQAALSAAGDAETLEDVEALSKMRGGLIDALRAILRAIVAEGGYGYAYPQPEGEDGMGKMEGMNGDEKKMTKSASGEGGAGAESLTDERIAEILKERDELRKRLEETERLAKAERVARLRKERVEELREMGVVGVDLQKAADLLLILEGELDRNVVKSDVDPAAEVRTLLKALAEHAKRLNLNKSIGVEAGDESASAEEKLIALAKAESEKTGAPFDQAFVKVAMEHPDLYKAYRG